MKKNILYIVLAVMAGLLIGYVVFSEREQAEAADHDHAEEMESGQMWTCSMHPQIMQPEPGDCPICGMDLIPADTGDSGLSASNFKLSENALALANIRTMVIGETEAASAGMLLSGKVMENEENNAVQPSYFSGRIEQLFINTTGESVAKGQMLATVYSPELVAAQQELLTAASLKSSQPALYKAVRNKLKIWKLSDKQIDAIESSGEVRENFPVYATVSGTVTEKLVQEGDYVKQGQPLFRIANLDKVWAVFDAYEPQLKSLRKGQKVSISTKAYPSQQFDGTISFINPVLNTRSRTVQVRAELDNREGLLKPGMFISGKVAVEGEKVDDALMIPSSAVMWTGERSVVYVKPNSAEPVFEMREVVLGRSSGDMQQVLEGLQAGEEIVVNGTFTVDAAAQLQGKKSMMNPDGGISMTGHEGHGTMDSPLQTTVNVNQDFIQSLGKTIPTYLELKDALIDGNNEKASQSAANLQQALAAMPLNSLGQSERSHIKKAGEMAEAIAENEELDNQRSHFVLLNDLLLPFYRQSGQEGATLYVQHCPMANNNKGAYWLSLQKEIRNPYYGEAMMNCGSVMDSITQSEVHSR